MPSTALAGNVRLIDVSLRDGLQDESVIVSLDGKLAIAQALANAGIKFIEATSFVHPRWVPQLADATDVIQALPRGPRYSALILNRIGFERAICAFRDADYSAGDYDLVFVVSASPRHAMANNNRTIDETLAIFDDIAAAAREVDVSLRATIACAFGSPWLDEGLTVEAVRVIAQRLERGGAHIITLADTVGLATPEQTETTIRSVERALGSVDLAMHMHDRSGNALENIEIGLGCGIRLFEGALAGLGGCPFAPDAPGNVDLGRVASMLHAKKIDTGLDILKLRAVEAVIRAAIAAGEPLKPLPSTTPAEARSPAEQP